MYQPKGSTDVGIRFNAARQAGIPHIPFRFLYYLYSDVYTDYSGRRKKQGTPFEDRCSHVEFRSDGHTHLLGPLAAEPCVRGRPGLRTFHGRICRCRDDAVPQWQSPIVVVLGWDGLPDADLCLRRPVTPIAAKNIPVIPILRLDKRLLPSTFHKIITVDRQRCPCISERRLDCHLVRIISLRSNGLSSRPLTRRLPTILQSLLRRGQSRRPMI